jgi:HK97 family phage major capsid protein
MELYAMPAATADAARRCAVNIDQWIAEEVEQAFAEQEGAAFVTGDGVNKPKGFLDYDQGRRRRLELGQDRLCRRPARPARLPRTIRSDVLIDLVYALKAGYRQNAPS